MKWIQQMNLRLRITLLTGVMILIAASSLTLASMYNARDKIIQTADMVKMEIISQDISPIPEDAPAASEKIEAGSAKSSVATIVAAPTIESELNQKESSLDFKAHSSFTASGVSPAFQITIAQNSRQFNIWNLIYTAIIVILGMLISYFLAGKAMKPVQQLNNAIAGISVDNLQQRLPAPVINDEIGQLTTSFNTMLDRLEDSFWRQKRFSSNVAHELKTPLATMKAGIQVLQLEEHPAKEDYQQVIQITNRNIHRLIHIVDDLMILTNEGYQEELEMISIQAVLRSITQELQHFYSEKKITVEYTFPQQENIIMGNETLINRLFYNLIENAFKYNHPYGAIAIVIEETEHTLNISITDTGIGIPEEALTHIFDPFYCVDPSRSRKSGGAGLGLSIVKTIAAQYGWSISVESAPQQSTRFTVSMKDPAFMTEEADCAEHRADSHQCSS